MAAEKVFYSNSIDEVNEICELLKKEEIEYNICKSNNSNPVFGTNVSVNVQDLCYQYSIEVEKKDADVAFSFINAHFPD